MKQKLLTLFVLLVSAMTAFADATGSGVAYDASKRSCVSFDYAFTETAGTVTFTITSVDASKVYQNSNDGNNVFIWDKTDDFKEKAGKTLTWENVATGKEIKVQIMWPVAEGQAISEILTYTVGTEAAPDTEKPVMVKAEATSIRDTRATLTLNATDDSKGSLTYKVTIGGNSYTTSGMDGIDATIDITGLTAETTYNFSVTATDNAKNESYAMTGSFTTTKALALPTPTAEPTDAAENVLPYYSNKYNTGLNAVGLVVYDKNWGKGYTDYKEVDLSPTDKAILVTGVGTWGLNLGIKDVTDYKKLCTDIYAYEEVPYNFEWEGTSITDKGTLKKGWNHLEIALGDAVRTGAHWVKFNIGTDAKHDYTVLFDNIYATKADIKFNITTSGNVAKVVGPITATEVEQINAADAMAIDLTGVSSITNDVVITPSKVNAIIIISGTEANNTPNSKYDAIKNMKNVVVLGTDGWYRPINQLVMTDIPGQPLWKGEGINKDWISTGETGWKLSRTIEAGNHASVCLPSGYYIGTIPEGLSVWQHTSYNEETGITFNHKTDEINSNFPLVIRNTTEKDIELAISNEGNINFKDLIANTAYKYKLGESDVWFCGNFEEALETDGTQWIVKNNGTHASVVKANGTKISPFRAYFTGIDGASAKLNFIDGEATGINGVNAEAAADGAIYNLAGQKVSAAYKGIVIKNGKKYLMK
ncbi:MAG: hypothetical protein SPJ21_08610 [Prevotella sp.]|nr:hypothetical protein [Prevotella sp.]